jgi:hypothetical protein
MEAESEDQPTCGKGIAANAVLPDKIAAVVRATADVLHNHIRALDPKETNGKAEIDAYHRLIAEHRALSDRLEALAALMRGYRDLPMASHDMGVIMDQRSHDAFAALVSSEEDLFELIQERVNEHSRMLEEMRREA